MNKTAWKFIEGFIDICGEACDSKLRSQLNFYIK